jgi:pentatricopeptide repeat protein
LISGYLRLNNTAKAWDVFDEMQLKYHKPDEVTYTMMIHACAKNDEVERALNLFEDMSNRGLYPTDVTFNTIINACARRPDYYDEAFNLLGQMQEVHGFVPDQVTYNTLLHGCAKKKDLNRAREIYRLILQKSASNGDHPQLAADDRTYSSLFWTYASYRPQRQKNLGSEPEKASDSALVPADESPLFPSLPSNRSELVKEAQSIFSYAKENTTINSAILNAYLGVHIAHHASGETIAIYQDLFDHWKVTRDGFTFKHILEHCYRTKDLQLAYKVWDDREEWLDGMRQSHYIEENEPQAVKRRKQLDLISSQTTNGWTVADQKESVLLMANTMSR